MPRIVHAAMLACALGLTFPALADRAPPRDGMPASEIMRLVEQRPDFGWLKEFEWDEDGYWEVEYRTPAGAERTLRLDPRTGQERRR